MKSITVKKLYAIHSWVGLITGILLFVVAFTGAVSVFGRPELKIWANPEIRTPVKVSAESIQALVDDYAMQVPESYHHVVRVTLPGERAATRLLIRFEDHKGDTSPREPAMAIQYEVNPHDLSLVNKREGELQSLFTDYDMDMADLLVDFHADLHLGRPWGLLTTGLLGLTLMVSIVTGVVIHRKILKQLFTFRPRKTLSLLVNDGHKVMGIWGIVFHGIISFSGAFLGLALVILVPAAAFVSFEGDQDKLLENFNTMPDPIVSHEYRPTQLAKALEHAQAYQEDSHLTNVNVLEYGDKNAMIYFNLIGGTQVHSLVLKYQGNSGEFVEAFGTFSKVEGVSGKILDLMFPLHFGNFGGLFVKILWTVLGLGTALLPLTGLMLWLERGFNASNPKHSPTTYQRFNRLVIGSCGGLVAACAVLFPVQLALNHLWPAMTQAPVLMSSFFGLWLAIIALTLVWHQTQRLVSGLVWCTAMLLMLVMPLDALLSGSHPFNLAGTGHYVAMGVNLTLFALGGSLVWLERRWRNQVAPSARNKNEISTKTEGAL